MVQEIIPQYTDDSNRDLWTQAAQAWRLPYWDWAIRKADKAGGSPNYNIPQIFQDAQIQITVASGPIIVDNPVYRFSMPNGKPMGTSGITNIGGIPVLSTPVRSRTMTNKSSLIPALELANGLRI